MNKLQLDLESLEVERLDVSVTALNAGVELLGMGHGSPELSQSCNGGCGVDTCACSDAYAAANSSCVASECSCDDCEG
ncbi:MAG: hypothetical protein ACRDRX_07480 [Pseudonocardiaceae bacterium]